MSEDFKGIPGGDPSRRPPMAVVKYSCLECGKVQTRETTNPKHFNAPEGCSTPCLAAIARKRAMTLVKNILGEAPETDAIPQSIADELLQMQEFVRLAKKKSVRIVKINCAHCGHEAKKFVLHSVGNAKKHAGRYCSWECRNSAAAKLPQGVVCRSPRKSAHSTLEESQKSAERLNAELLKRGDMEGVRPYECSCGQWHVGHGSKNDWLLAAKKSIAILENKAEALIRKR